MRADARGLADQRDIEVHDPATGAVRLQQRWRARFAASVNAATPVVVDDMIFVSASYETGAEVLRVKDGMLTPLWQSDEVLSNHYATSVYSDGTLYGFHGRQEYTPSLRAVTMKTGMVRWSVDNFGAGTVTLAGDRLLVVHEKGELMIAPASPQAFKPTARKQILSGTVRAYPALADGVLYVRNDDTLVAVDLK